MNWLWDGSVLEISLDGQEDDNLFLSHKIPSEQIFHNDKLQDQNGVTQTFFAANRADIPLE